MKSSSNFQSRPTGIIGNCITEKSFQSRRPRRKIPIYKYWVAEVASVSLDRWNAETPDDYLHGSPELVIEVASPGNTGDELIEKRRLCLKNGCLSFWIVASRHEEIHVSDHAKTLTYSESMSIALPEPMTGSSAVHSVFGPSK